MKGQSASRVVVQVTGLAASGLILGPAIDQIHVQTGTLSYAHPWWLEQAWWVGPQFAVAFVVMFYATRSLQVAPRAASPAMLIWRVVALLAAYFATGLWHEHPWWVAGGLTVALVARAASEHFDARMWLSMALLAIGGSAYEAILSSFNGTFSYADPSVFGIPASLALLYLHSGPFVVSLTRHESGLPKKPA